MFSGDMVADTGRVLSPSAHKPQVIAEALTAGGWPIEFIAPQPTAVDDFCRVHDARFVEDVLQMKRANGFGSTSPSVARSLPYTTGACYDSAFVAMKEGVSASLTSGFHHAGPSGGRAYCTFNGLMVAAAQLLAEERVQQVAIVDADYHYGDGTQAIIDLHGYDDRVQHVSFGQTYKRPAQADHYLEAVRGLRARFAQRRPDLILYQAGADTHVNDPLGGLLTTAQMRERDREVFTIARDLDIPVTWNLAGGYQVEEDGSIPRVVELHLNTFEEALRTWGLAVPARAAATTSTTPTTPVAPR
ncbi:MAG TPA: hypothetical protein VGF99_10410 [Myxococcota bacterium]